MKWIACKYLLPFYRLLIYCVHCFRVSRVKCAKLFNLIKFHLSISLLFPGIWCRKSLSIPMSFRVFPMFSFYSVKVSSLKWRYPLWIDFYICWEIRTQLHPSACGYQIFLAPFIKKYHFFGMYVLSTFVKNQLAVCGFYFTISLMLCWCVDMFWKLFLDFY